MGHWLLIKRCIERLKRIPLKRFAPATVATRWHFVIIARQVLLTTVGFVGGTFSRDDSPWPEALRESQLGVCIEGGAAMLVLAANMALQIKVRPFRYALHNALELFLGVCDVLLVGLCGSLPIQGSDRAEG